VPSVQDRKTSRTLVTCGADSSSSQPSAKDCIMPYSMPLWTIFEKWPAPTAPACTNPLSPSGLSASKIGITRATSASSPPTIRA
jgi:hypothetical protein